MDPDEQRGAVTREEFNRLRGYLIGLTNAVRALIELAPDKAVALVAVEKCFDTEAAMGQSAEHLDIWKLEGLQDSLDEMRAPIRHDLVVDADPNGLIAKAEQGFRDRQDAMNAEVMAKLLRPPGSDGPSIDDAP